MAAPVATTGRDLRPHTSLIGITMVLRMPTFPRVARLWPLLALALYAAVQPALAIIYWHCRVR